MQKYCVTGDIQKAFLQIRVQEQDQDAQRVLWFDNLSERNVKEYRFTRVIFGATSSPYILGATLSMGRGVTEEDAVKFKEESTKILSEGGFAQVAQQCEEFEFRATSL